MPILLIDAERGFRDVAWLGAELLWKYRTALCQSFMSKKVDGSSPWEGDNMVDGVLPEWLEVGVLSHACTPLYMKP